MGCQFLTIQQNSFLLEKRLILILLDWFTAAAFLQKKARFIHSEGAPVLVHIYINEGNPMGLGKDLFKNRAAVA